MKKRNTKQNENLEIFASKLFETKIKDFINIASMSFKEREERVQSTFEQIRKDLKEHHEYVDVLDKERIKSYAEVQQAIQKNSELTDRLSTSTEKLHNILSNSRLRGQFGEKIAEDVMRATGLIEGTHYLKNKKQETLETRPDFTFLLPDGHKINMDVKFPLENFARMIECMDWESGKNAEAEKFKKAFERDVKEKLKEVSGRDYINPSEGTLDFVILFIPNESIASYIHETFPEIFEMNVRNKVVLTSPYQLISFVNMVQRSFQNFYQRENIRDTLLLINEFSKRYELFKERFIDIGERIDKTRAVYDDIAEKSFKNLDSSMSKIERQKTQLPSESKKNLEIENKTED
ncbi:DNA recombination protein RmuC [Patescibacteria group bacterium]|nr:DNA recombination protein RmuC [Patescibacteria group bacterium]